VLLLAGSAVAHGGLRRNARGAPDGGRPALIAGAALVLAFLATQAAALLEYGQPPQSHAYASLVHVLVGYQGLHAALTVAMATFVWLRSRRGLVDAARPRDWRVVILFWHYTTGLWLIGVVPVHLFPRLQ